MRNASASPLSRLRPLAYPHQVSESLFLGEMDILNLPQELWIVQAEDYLDLARESGEGAFLPEPRLQGSRAVLRYVESLIRQRLREDRFEREGRADDVRWSTPSPRQNSRVLSPSSDTAAEQSFAASVIQWTTDRVVDAFRVLALRGVESASWHVRLTETTFRLGVQCQLLEPVTEAAFNYVMHPKLGILHLINLGEELRDFDLDKRLEPGNRRFALLVEHRVAAETAAPIAELAVPAAEPPGEVLADEAAGAADDATSWREVQDAIAELADEAEAGEGATEHPQKEFADE
jgi:hypothetical protein